MAYIVARTKGGRPSLQHQTFDFHTTTCGLQIEGWSAAKTSVIIPQIYCKRCNSRAATR